MLTLQKTNGAGFPFRQKSRNGALKIATIPVGDRALEDLLKKEWLLTNACGSYASSTIIDCNTSKYHGLLIGSLNPPVNRIMALANCLEMVIFSGNIFNLSTFEFSDKFAPKGFKYIKQFRRDIGVHFDYQLAPAEARAVIPAPAFAEPAPCLTRGVNSSPRKRRAGIQLTKSVYLLRDTNTVALMYDFTSVQGKAEFILRPFIGLRDSHELQKSYAPLYSAWLGNGLLIRHDVPESCELFLSCSSMSFEKDPQWWFNFVYRNDRQRGQDFTEDLWTPGFLKCCLDSPTKIVLWANLSSCVSRAFASLEARDAYRVKGKSKKEEGNTQYAIRNTQYDIEAVREDLNRHQNNVIAAAKTSDRNLRTLRLAADQFIVTRGPEVRTRTIEYEGARGQGRVTILAGFPWFADWGRDTFIALPGLMLSGGRFEEAKSVLTTFAQTADDGLIPNRFDDSSNTAYFNSVDASLWFINAAFQYLYATDDLKTFTQRLLPTIRWIIDSFYNGTRFDIHADDDCLITAGNGETQLTWMDAKYDGIAITARYGKAVEVNALWYNALCLLAQFYASRDVEGAKHFRSIADKVAASFCRVFWNETAGYLNDCILPDGSADATLRPNQIFAVSLEFSPLPRRQQRAVIDVVGKNLLTPFGLRTLNTHDSRYKGSYTGPRQQRDAAYHQGTVWPYLIGPFVASYLKVNDFNRKAKKKAAEFIQPLMHHLTEDGCIGSVSEIFDGDAPHKPRGCIAQAWSVAELIRAYQLINS